MFNFMSTQLLCGLLVCAGWVHAVEPAITFVTRGGPAVSMSPKATGDREIRYGVGLPVQIGADKAALFCNRRVVGSNRWDYEDGSDVFVFDDLKNINAGDPVPIARNEKEKDKITGEQRFIVKYTAKVGFWPLAAKRADGTPHPGAGKGFAFCLALSFVGTGEELLPAMYSPSQRKHYVETMQLEFNGNVIAVTQRKLIRKSTKWFTLNGWSISAPGLQAAAIPDGDDLLLAVTASRGKGRRTGVGRFRFSEEQWIPYSFTPVADGSEPSIARRADGSFVFTTRSTKKSRANSIELWTSKDAEGTWSQHMLVTNIRNASPVSVNATVDGRIFVLGNYPALNCLHGKVPWKATLRSQLALWQLAEGKAEFNPPKAGLVRDAVAEFGTLDKKHRWFIDQPVASTIQLADGLWHTLVAYRVMAFWYKARDGELITPHTGCYVEELSALQPARPPWNFD